MFIICSAIHFVKYHFYNFWKNSNKRRLSANDLDSSAGQSP